MVPCDVRGVVGQIKEQTDVVHGTVLFKVRLKEPGCLHVDLREKTSFQFLLLLFSLGRCNKVQLLNVTTRWQQQYGK